MTEVRKLGAPACLRSRISRRRVGRVKVGVEAFLDVSLTSDAGGS
jgi:hypothetical protein